MSLASYRAAPPRDRVYQTKDDRRQRLVHSILSYAIGPSRGHSAADFAYPPHVSAISRITRQGFPAAKTSPEMSRVTTLPAPITAREPIRTPGQIIAPPPTQTSAPISIG